MSVSTINSIRTGFDDVQDAARARLDESFGAATVSAVLAMLAGFPPLVTKALIRDEAPRPAKGMEGF